MYVNVLVKEPLEKVMADWDFLQEKVIGHFSTFKPDGQNIYGIRRRSIDAQDVVDPRKGSITEHHELGPSGITTWHHAPFKLHITSSGTPHRVSHSFGYWHVNDMDELYLPLPNPNPEVAGYSVICMGNPQPGEADRFVWYCQKCLTMLFERRYPTGDEGFNGFWKAERDAVTAYNANARNQECPECGHQNPKGYCWNVAKDSTEETQARQAW